MHCPSWTLVSSSDTDELLTNALERSLSKRGLHPAARSSAINVSGCSIGAVSPEFIIHYAHRHLGNLSPDKKNPLLIFDTTKCTVGPVPVAASGLAHPQPPQRGTAVILVGPPAPLPVCVRRRDREVREPTQCLIARCCNEQRRDLLVHLPSGIWSLTIPIPSRQANSL